MPLIQSNKIRRRFMEDMCQLGSKKIARKHRVRYCRFLLGFSNQVQSEAGMTDTNEKQLNLENHMIKTNRKVSLVYSLLKCTAKPILATWRALLARPYITRQSEQGSRQCKVVASVMRMACQVERWLHQFQLRTSPDPPISCHSHQ